MTTCHLKTNGFLEKMALADAIHDMGNNLSTLDSSEDTINIVKRTIPQTDTSVSVNIDHGHGVELMGKYLQHNFNAPGPSNDITSPELLFNEVIPDGSCNKLYKRFYSQSKNIV